MVDGNVILFMSLVIKLSPVIDYNTKKRILVHQKFSVFVMDSIN